MQPRCSCTHATGKAPAHPSPGLHLNSTALDAIQALRTTIRVCWTQFEHCRPQFEYCGPRFELAELDPERGRRVLDGRVRVSRLRGVQAGAMSSCSLQPCGRPTPMVPSSLDKWTEMANEETKFGTQGLKTFSVVAGMELRTFLMAHKELPLLL
ncbi:hypothetical protein PAHAL_9G143600 [Panicum hallii]|uniref:Uncharacterized protein n=1 Tax=Panicum hallii TaxID=206008 RepID=A0A2T8I158_9POAL|nr:hypothetical protein PAHAL_9G143600 [Panicum hallii]